MKSFAEVSSYFQKIKIQYIPDNDENLRIVSFRVVKKLETTSRECQQNLLIYSRLVKS